MQIEARRAAKRVVQAPDVPLAPQAEPACALCGAASTQPLLDVGERFGLIECRRCGLIATAPAVPESEIGAYYPPSYYGTRNRRFHPILERLVALFRRRRADHIQGYVKAGRLLDVGCGRGLIPKLLRARGWQTYGTEISDVAAWHARQELELPVYVGPLPQSPYPAGFFDVVVIWHVLEHAPAPRPMLEKARELLRPNGLLVLAVPNYDSLQARWTGRHWFHLDVPRHYVHFRLTTLRRLLRECGFSVREVSHFSLEQNPFGWMQSLLNLLGFRRNLLYDALKRPGARDERHPLRDHRWQAAAMLLLLPIVLPLTCMLSLLEVIARRGGTVEIYATRDQ